MLIRTNKDAPGNMPGPPQRSPDVRLSSGVVVPRDVADARREQERWSKGDFKLVARAIKFLKEKMWRNR